MPLLAADLPEGSPAEPIDQATLNISFTEIKNTTFKLKQFLKSEVKKMYL